MTEQAIQTHIFLLYGTDEFAMNETVQKMIAALGDSTTASMNISRLEGEELTQNDFINATQAMPFLSAHRLVIFNDPMSAFRKIHDKEKLHSLLEQVPETTRLVMVQGLDKYGGNNKLFTTWFNNLVNAKLLKGRLKTSLHSLPKAKEMSVWITKEVGRQSSERNKPVKISLSAAELLGELTGNETRVASLEVSKLLEYVNYERDITREDIEMVGVGSAFGDRFALQDALGKKDLKATQKALSGMLKDNEPPAIWSLIINYFRNLLLTRELLDSGGNVPDVMRELGQKEYSAKKLVEQAGHFSLLSLERLHHRLLELDEAIKTSQTSTDLALDLLVFELGDQVTK